MADNFIQDGKRMVLGTVAGAESGDAYVVGDYLPCVLLTDAETASPYNATVQVEGVFDLSVIAHNGSENAAVSAGDLLYWADKDTALDLDSSETPFGIALEAIDSGETATIKVLLVPKAIVPGTVTASALGASAVETAKIKDENVTLAKLEDLTQGSLISGQGSDRPGELDASGDGQILVGDGTDVNSVAVSGDVTLTNEGVVTIGTDAVTSPKIDESVIQTVEKAFTAAEIKTLYSANTNKGLEIVAAPGASKVIEFISATMFYDYDDAEAYTAANGLTFNVGAIAVSDTLAATFLEAAADRVAIVQALSAEVNDTSANLANKALYLQEGTTNPTGDATAEDQLLVRVSYRIHDFS